ncbi:MAG: hypothetical protein ACI36W_06330 [Coriobacteriales bacterium]
MPDISIQRQLKGTLRLLQVQLARAGETFKVEQALANCLESGKITQADAEYIRSALALQDEPGRMEALPPAEAEQLIKHVHKLTSCNLNMGDSA